MARKSKDPRKPSQAYLAATGQLKPATEELPPPPTPAKAVAPPVTTPAKSTPVKKPSKSKPVVPVQSNEDDDLLRREIKALGGDDEDWEMLKDLSDSEEEAEVDRPSKAIKGKTSTLSSVEVSLRKICPRGFRCVLIVIRRSHRFPEPLVEIAQERALCFHEEFGLCRCVTR